VTSASPQQIREGQVGAQVVLEGTGLANVTAATIGGAPAQVSAASEASVTLTFSLPHAVTGALTVHVESGLGAWDGSPVVATEINVSPTGDDQAAGTIDQPFLTIAHAVTVADAGDHIVLAAGSHDVAQDVTLPRNVTLMGAGISQTTVRLVAVEGYHLQVSAGSRVENLTVDGTHNALRCVETAEAGAYLGGVAVTGCQHGVYTSYDLNVVGATLTGNSAEGMWVTGGTTVLTGSRLSNNGYTGLTLSTGGHVTMTTCELADNANDGILNWDGVLQATGSSVHGSVHGIRLLSTNGSTLVTYSNGAFFSNTVHIDDERPGRPALDGNISQFESNLYDSATFTVGVVVGASSKAPYYQILYSDNRLEFI
jgi:hypothetical protein